jgi:chemotaxis signal transduction protein
MSNNDSLLATSVPAACGLREFVIARVGAVHVAVPADRVEAVVDGRVGAEPPCDEQWVGGWFEHRDRLWLAVRIDGRAERRAESVKRIVVRESDDLRFAIEVDEVYGPAVLDDVADAPVAESGWIAPAGWLRRGAAFDGRPVCCVDVDAVAGHIAVN